jgi:hypothetical protein
MERPRASEESPLSPAAIDLIALARQAEYPSELRALPKVMARAALHGLRPGEVSLVQAAIAARQTELTAPYQPELPDDSEMSLAEPATAPEPWTPTRILESLPPGPVELDWMERQLPSGDRD